MKYFYLFISFLFFTEAMVAQEKFTKTPTKTFISRENLTRYYRAAVDSDFFSENEGELNFDASLFGIKKIFKPSLDVDTAYTKRSNRTSRKIQLGFSLTKGENSSIESFTPSLRYAILDNRDFKPGHFHEQTIELGRWVNQILIRNTENRREQIRNSKDGTKEWEEDSTEYYEAEKRYFELVKEGNQSFGMFPDEFKRILNEDIKEMLRSDSIQRRMGELNMTLDASDVTASNFNNVLEDTWKNEIEKVSRRSLLTFAVDWTHSEKTVNALSGELKYLVGLNPNRPEETPWNLELSSTFSFDNDTIMEENSIDERQIFMIAGNLGKVLLQDKEDNSLLELKAGVSYENILEGVRDDEEESVFNLNLSLTPKISEDLYLPIELKYDPDEGNVLGFLKLEWNFNANKN